MSRIGKMPITIPSGVTDNGGSGQRGQSEKAAKASLSEKIPPQITVDVKDGEVELKRASDSKERPRDARIVARADRQHGDRPDRRVYQDARSDRRWVSRAEKRQQAGFERWVFASGGSGGEEQRDAGRGRPEHH